MCCLLPAFLLLEWSCHVTFYVKAVGVFILHCESFFANKEKQKADSSFSHGAEKYMNRPGLDKNQFMTEKRVFYLCLNDHMT